MKVQATVHDPYVGTTFACEFSGFPICIGRDAGCHLRLPYRFVSRRHARIELTAGGIALIDEGSRNGIECDGRRAVRGTPWPLRDGCELRMKRLIVIVRFRAATQPLGTLLEDASTKRTTLYADRGVVPEVVDRVGAAVAECRSAWRAATRAAASLAVVPPAEREAVAKQLADVAPALVPSPLGQLGRTAARAGVGDSEAWSGADRPAAMRVRPFGDCLGARASRRLELRDTSVDIDGLLRGLIPQSVAPRLSDARFVSWATAERGATKVERGVGGDA
jgi:hypothetical protein